jgi:hypothetical protein
MGNPLKPLVWLAMAGLLLALVGCKGDSANREGDVELTPEQKKTLGTGPSDGPSTSEESTDK